MRHTWTDDTDDPVEHLSLLQLRRAKQRHRRMAESRDGRIASIVAHLVVIALSVAALVVTLWLCGNGCGDVGLDESGRVGVTLWRE